MYTKNPVSGKNETLVNTSMLKGAIDGVSMKIADKADKGALDSLSVYTEGVKTTVAGKADKSAVEAVSVYAEGMLSKDVYETMVDAYVGLACKVADPDVLEGAAKMAYAADPVKYATSNPDREDVVEVKYKVNNPIYEAISAADITVELPPFLRLKRWDAGAIGSHVISWKTELPNLTYSQSMFFYQEQLTSWTTELPNLTYGSEMFWSTGLTSWDVELPNLTNGQHMFSHTSIEEWNVELPKLTNGSGMFANGSSYNPDTPAALKRFRGTLPALVDGAGMFTNCQLDLESLRRIAESINDVNDLTEGDEVTKRLDICVGFTLLPTPAYISCVETIRDKGWTLTVNDVLQ